MPEQLRGCQNNCAAEKDDSDPKCDGTMIQRPGHSRTIELLQKAHDRVLVFRMELSTE